MNFDSSLLFRISSSECAPDWNYRDPVKPASTEKGRFTENTYMYLKRMKKVTRCLEGAAPQTGKPHSQGHHFCWFPFLSPSHILWSQMIYDIPFSLSIWLTAFSSTDYISQILKCVEPWFPMFPSCSRHCCLKHQPIYSSQQSYRVGIIKIPWASLKSHVSK